MKIRTTFILLVAVLALGAFIALVERKGQTTKELEEQARKALAVDPARVSYLRFETTNLVVECAKEGDEWMVVQPVRARASVAEIARILSGLQNLPRGEVITPAEQRARNLAPAQYGLDAPRASITFGDSMQRRTILVGRNAPLGDGLYIKLNQRDDVIATTTNLLGLLPGSVAAVRDRAVFTAGPERVQRVEITGPGGFVQISLQDKGRWMIQQPLVTRASASAVLGLVDALYALRVADFVSDGGGDVVAYGLDDPDLKITLGSGEKDGETTLLIGNAVKNDPSLVYAKRASDTSICTLPTNALGRLRVGLGELRDRRLMSLDPSAIGRVEVRENDRKLTLEAQGGKWRVTEPRQWMADEELVQALLRGWAGASVSAFVDGVGTNVAAHGFAPAAREVAFFPAAPAGGRARDEGGVRIEISREKRDGESALARVVGEDPLYAMDAALLDTLSVDPLFYRDRKIMNVPAEDVTSIAVRKGDREQVVQRDEAGVFRPAGVSQYVLDDEAVKAILIVVGELRAAEFVADDPDDLSPFGLDAPAASLTVGLRKEAGISRSILFGAAAGDAEVYAMLKGRDVVFVVEKAISAALLQNLYAVPKPSAEEAVDAGTIQNP